MSSQQQTRKQRPGGVVYVGVGPGDERLLTLRAAELIASADVLGGEPDVLGRLRHLARAAAQVLELPPAGVAKLLAGSARDGNLVVRLVRGDPGLDPVAAEEIDGCARARVLLEIVPGIPEGLGVAAYAGVLPGRRAGGVLLASPQAGEPKSRTTIVTAGSPAGLAALAEELVAAGRGAAPAAVTFQGTATTQRSIDTDLAGAARQLQQGPVAERAVLVVGDPVSSRDRYSWFESKPLFGWRVLVPRTREQSAGLCDRLRSYGAVPEEVPTIAVEPPRTPQAVDRAIHGLVSGRYQWVAFTSTNAVRAVREKLEELGLDARAFAGVKVAAVGEATAEAIQSWGIRPELVPSGAQSSDGLLAEWPEYESGIDPLDRVFLPRADIATETLSAGLVERGWQVDDVTAYRTVRAAPPPAETREAIKTGGFDAVLFTSSSTVRNLVGIAGKPHTSTVIAVIGPQTAKTAEELGLRVDVMAAEASALLLADALAEFGNKRRLANEHLPPGKANRARVVARVVKKAK